MPIEDIVQEGMIGLFKAIRDYKEDKLSSFKAFAELCITRQIITAIKTATRQKHIPLNSYVSLDKPIYDEESDRTLLDVISEAKVTDPEEMIISQEEYTDIESKISELLSDLERKVLSLYLDGRSYQEISEQLNRHVKSIDNALQVKKSGTIYGNERKYNFKFISNKCYRCKINHLFSFCREYKMHVIDIVFYCMIHF